MLHCTHSVAPIAVVALVNFILSWLWYSPLLFAKPWLIALGLDPNRGPKDMTDAEKKRMPFLFLGGVASSVLRATSLAVLVSSLGAKSFGEGAAIGLLTWAGFALTYSFDTLWEGRKGKVLLINNGLLVLTHAVFGGVLAVWG